MTLDEFLSWTAVLKLGVLILIIGATVAMVRDGDPG